MERKSQSKKLSTRELCFIAIFTAVISAMAPFTIPFPLVPLSMQTFAVPLAGAVLGAKKGTIAVIVYLILGAIGIPVFTGFTGGFGLFLGPTGGYLWSFPIFAFVVGFAADKGNRLWLALGLIVGAAITLTMGMIQLASWASLDMRAAFMAGVFPFIIPELIKIFMVFIIAPKARQALGRISGNSLPRNTGKSIKLRPHHLLCTQSYNGKGYSTDFVKNMTAVTTYLRNNDNASVEIVFTTDDLCSKCPKKISDNLCESNDKVTRFDEKVVSYFGIEEKCYIYKDITNEINTKMTPAVMADICGDCQWHSTSGCREKILGL